METKKKNRKSKAAFWRSCRYLGPHRKLVVISIVCAFVVGAAFTSGLGTMLPIMQVLIGGDTMQDYVNRKIVESRLDVRLAEDAEAVRLVKMDPGGAASTQGLKIADALWLRDGGKDSLAAPRVLETLSDPAVRTIDVVVNDRPARLELVPVARHYELLRTAAAVLPRDRLKAIAAVLAVLMGVAVFGNIVRFFQEYLSEKAATLATTDLRRHVYDHALHLPLGFFGVKGTSDVTSRITQDATGLQDGMKQLLGKSVQETLKAVMALGLAIFISWQLTLFIIFFGPVMFILIRKFGKKIRRATRAALQNSSIMLGQIESSLAGIRVVKAAGAERHERRRFKQIMRGLVREQLRIARIEAFNTPVLELLTLAVVCIIVLWASYLVLNKSIETSTFFLVMACLMGIGESLRKVSKINNLLQRANAAAGRLFEIMDMGTERPRSMLRGGAAAPAQRSHKPITGVQREIRFEGLTFTYPGGANPAISDVNLTVAKGQSVAVVGRNGSGKTTLLALLPRFYEPQQGRITIDGVDVRDVTLRSLRRQIGIVTQDSVIFPGTIAQNIAYAMPLANREDIVDAAKRAFAHEFIMEKADGYDTLLGEHGAQLSGGQKQRLCIARAILRKTPILILDEATSQVDAESEHLIQQAIQSLMHERTTFVIAHRFSTILSADVIVIMDRGQIVAMGSHEHLLATCPTYQQLYERQIVAPAAG